MKNIIEEAEKVVDNILDKMSITQEQEKDVTMNDIKDFVDDLKERGFSDTGKIQGVLNKANSIARGKGKGGNKKIVAGIMAGMFRGK